MEAKKDAVVLYPSPAIGHIISMVELGKLLLAQSPSLSIHILITTPPFKVGRTAPYLARAAAATKIIFHHLPIISTSLEPSSSVHREILAFNLLRLNNPNITQYIASISRNHSLRAIIIDFFCYTTLGVAREIGIPCYFFMTSGAAFLACMFHFPQIHSTTTRSFKDMEEEIQIPGLPPIPSKDMLKPVQDRSDRMYTEFLNAAIQIAKGDGVIVNTFEAFESRVLKALAEGICVVEAPTPPIFCVGPIIDDDPRDGDDDECLKWLDSQPKGSVVFLCFGSLGIFSGKQLTEIALGLERSKHRFLWVVRSPDPEDLNPDLDSLLPLGFVSRTKEIGLVVKNWCPQVAVLNHESVGGFVSHCGWNSVMEAVCAGVGLVAWPLYAEQRFNRAVLVDEMKVALRMEEEDGEGWVSAAEVERRVIELMESEEGRKVRRRMREMKKEAEKAKMNGGSSRAAMSKLVQSWWNLTPA